MINVLADRYLYNISAYLPPKVNILLYDPAEGLPDLSNADGLLIRTVNPINAETISDIPDSLSFIGTGSSGTDHVDQPFLRANNIAFADAAGCNALSVAEYVAVGLLLWAEQTGSELQQLKVGIVGKGYVGTEINKLLASLGLTTVCYDPPKEEQEASFSSASKEELLTSDILTFHTPLNTVGQYPTYHWLDEEVLADYSFRLVINTARGGVVDEQALLEAFQNGTVDYFILDVWEDEPHIRKRSAANAFLRTPHIAGYSVQAKEKASKLVTDALLNHFGLKRASDPARPDPKIFTQSVDRYNGLSDLLTVLHPIRTYQQKLARIINEHWDDRGPRFNKLRASFPLRQEFNNIRLPQSYADRFPVLEKLGFRLIS
ncbi:MAG TPA: 4-phosphoerythronate dehydrogenase [Fodinibius sp.]|nr:4-phosphoerythronate dehydrogenase [Fodinibius sp.]